MKATERRMANGLSLAHMRWLAPWIERHATPAERHFIHRTMPLPFRIMLALNRHRYALLERKVFGP